MVQKQSDDLTPGVSVTVMIVDDDEAVRDSLAEYLTSSGWSIVTVPNAHEALKLIREDVGDIIISDIRMPGMDGLTFLEEVKAIDPELDFILTTGFSSEDVAIQALRLGAFDYFRKPLNGAEVEASLQRTRKMLLLKRENRRLRELLARVSHINEQHAFVGRSERAQDLLNKLRKVANAANTTCLLTGESGTGKEVAARMIHQLSRPADAPFIAVNCGGIPDTLLESELFGHEKGAFTGAEKRVSGVFELAIGGTVLLDEISEMSMQAQSRFLRVLEDRRFMRLGGSREVSLENTRIIAATNRNLQQLVDDGKFRSDLYFRISVAPVHIAPLRERPTDILPLAYHFLERFSKDTGAKYHITSAAEEALKNYNYPGNARDLRNIIERACIFAENNTITPEDLGLPGTTAADRHAGPTMPLTEEGQRQSAQMSLPAGSPPAGATLNLSDAEKQLVIQALERHPENHSAAARALGISPQALYRKMEKHDIEKQG